MFDWREINSSPVNIIYLTKNEQLNKINNLTKMIINNKWAVLHKAMRVKLVIGLNCSATK